MFLEFRIAFKKLKPWKKTAIGLLQAGTALEYFDLMLYIHLGIMFEHLFFPTMDPNSQAIVSAISWCIPFVFRPLGALLIGIIGDIMGRRATVVLTTFVMGTASLVIASTEVYEKAGLYATFIVALCRIAQGMAAMGEICGAKIYITEITKPPVQYVAVGFIGFASLLGGMAALLVASSIIRKNADWRFAFLVASTLAFFGSAARTKLREVGGVANFKTRIQQRILETYEDEATINKMFEELDAYLDGIKIPFATSLAFFCVNCGYPFVFFMVYNFFQPILKKMGYSSADIISHNFFVGIGAAVTCFFYVPLCARLFPLKIIKIRGMIGTVLLLMLPFCIQYVTCPTHVFTLQILLLAFILEAFPADSIFILAFPIEKRFVGTAVVYALSRAFMHLTLSFGLIYLTKRFSVYGVWFVALPLVPAFFYGVWYFENMERQKRAGTYVENFGPPPPQWLVPWKAEYENSDLSS